MTMKSLLFKLLLLLWLISFKAHSGSQGEWDIGGKVSGVKNGNEFGIKTGIKCEYHIFSILTWRSDLEAFAHSTDLSRIDISLPSNLHLMPDLELLSSIHGTTEIFWGPMYLQVLTFILSEEKYLVLKPNIQFH
jgi:hypothetical protein